MSDCNSPQCEASVLPLNSPSSSPPVPSSFWPDTSQSVLILQHSPRVPPGFVARFLAEQGVPYYVLHIADDPSAKLPPFTTQWRAIIALGGPQGSYEEPKYSWMRNEKEFLRHHTMAGTPLLGICLGCQMLADALGGRVYEAPKFEVGYSQVELTEEGAKDEMLVELFKKFPIQLVNDDQKNSTESSASSSQSLIVDRFLMHHGDTFDLPPSIPLLAKSHYKQVFRMNRALGVQFHPEASVDEISMWSSWNPSRYPPLGTSAEELVTLVSRRREECTNMSRAFFEAWWKSSGYEVKKVNQ